MNKITIPYHQTGFFSSMMLDYLEDKESLRSFYHNPVSMEGFQKQIHEKQFTQAQRELLCEVLEKQYSGLSKSSELTSNLKALQNTDTYTVTTGHQLNLFTGPLYFLYKIVSTIKLAEKLKALFPDKNFVPVFWMATEDHDFEEVNHFNLFGVKHQLDAEFGGAVGRLKLTGIEQVFNQLDETLNGRTGLESILQKLKTAYHPENTFAQATRILVNELFGDYGIVILDGDDPKLKSSFVPFMKDEIVKQTNASHINKTSDQLEKLGYKKQVNPREINLFYLQDGLRERIVQKGDSYEVNNTELTFSKDELIDEIENHPERFSPNAVLRPLFQEVVLPNLAYIGGGGELAYWLQLKTMFESNQVTFPILLLRNSVLLIDQGTQKKINKLELTTQQLFQEEEELIKEYLKAASDFELDLKQEERQIESIYEDIVQKAHQTDPSLEGMVRAELQKNLKSLKNIENRLIKAEKQKEAVRIDQIRNVKDRLFPGGSLQERKDNLIYAYLLLGDELISILIANLDPLQQEFTALNL